jgi:conjugal transfer pilus assembly protein TraV
MKQSLIKFGVILFIASLSACNAMNSSFDCPNKAGTSCKSLDQINRMVDSGQLQSKPDVSMSNSYHKTPEFQSVTSFSNYKPGEPLRYGETVQRIWIAPYEDTEGNYHQESVLYTIVKDGHWIGTPVQSVKAT